MGGLRSKIPTTYAMMLIGTLALTGVGIPHLFGFAGFHSKDAIIEAAFAGHTPGNVAFWMLVAAAFMTSFYSWRLIFMTFHQSPRWPAGDAHHGHEHGGDGHADHGQGDHEHHHGPHESPLVMLVPLFVLAAGAVAAGFTFQKFFIGHDYKAFWGKALVEGPSNHIMHALHEVPGWVGWTPFAAMSAGLALAYTYYIAAPWLPEATARSFRPLYLFFLNKWYFDELYDWLFVRPANAIGGLLWRKGDGATIDGIIDGTAAGVGRITNRVVKLQSGYVYHYAFAMMLGLAAMMSWFMLGFGGAR